MTQGISSSLNITLARMSSIENGFFALEKISNQLNSANSVVNSKNSDFKTILDGKVKELEEQNKKQEEAIETSPIDIETKIPDTKEQNNNLTEENTKKPEEIKKITNEDSKESIKEAINLKSKIDLKAQSANVEEIIEALSNQYNVDSDFIKAIIKQESGFNTNATSKKGAMGLMQLMPETAKSLGVVDAYNPTQNIEGGVRYLRGLLDRFDNNKELALAAYNAGPTAVKKYGGIPPYKETQNYVNSIMSSYGQMKNVQEVLNDN